MADSVEFDSRPAAVFVDRALQTRTRIALLEAAHRRNLGRTGSARAGSLLAVAREGGASDAERRLHRILREAGLQGWQIHFTSCGFEIDVAFPASMVAIEVDGWAWHRGAHRFARDAERQNVLTNAGWRVLRFTWHHVVNSPERVLADVFAAIR